MQSLYQGFNKILRYYNHFVQDLWLVHNDISDQIAIWEEAHKQHLDTILNNKIIETKSEQIPN